MSCHLVLRSIEDQTLHHLISGDDPRNTSLHKQAIEFSVERKIFYASLRAASRLLNLVIWILIIFSELTMRAIFLTISFLMVIFSSFSAKADEKNRYKQSFSVQIGINGSLQDSSSYGLQFLPPDLAYSHELFDNDVINISTATFYDNIGVKVKNTNFSYRVGQRLDFGMELGKYTPYLTLGFGMIRNAHHYQTSPVYGTGFLIRISERFLLVNEVNFQNVIYNNLHYDIVNLSSGLVYAF